MKKIYMTIGEYTHMIDTARNAAAAEAKIHIYKRQDRQEIEYEGYPMPTAWKGKYPEYYYI